MLTTSTILAAALTLLSTQARPTSPRRPCAPRGAAS